jgi:DNA-binding winged helix-turn-helix (wHTH) protein/TolB-like protein/Tfp pilus assembly protein PilF
MAMNEASENIFEFNGFRLDPARRRLTKGAGESIQLMPKTYDTLLYLVENSGRVIEKDELLREIWADTVVEENNLTQNISALRRIFGEKPGEHRFIVTIPSRGYKFVAEVAANAGRGGEYDESTESLSSEPVVSESEKKDEDTAITGGLSKVYKVVAAVFILGVISTVAWWQIGSTGSDVPIRTVAVLPFANLSPGEETEYLSDAIAESAINSLSHLTELRVISRNSTFRYKESQLDTWTIGSQLGAEAIVMGDVRQVGDDLVINVRLIRAADDTQLWGQQYVKRSTDLIGIQGEIAQAVAQNLRVRLSSRESQLLAKRETDNPEAWELYHRGRFYVFRLTPNEVQKGLEYFRRAIEIDPDYALAYTGIADAYRSLTLSAEMPPVENLTLSKNAALKAIEIDDLSSEGHSSVGMTNFWGDWDWVESERRYIRAIELNPNNAMAHLFYAHLQSNLGKHDDALALVKRSRALDPVFPFGNALEGQFLLHAGRVDEAIERLERTVEIAPNFWMPHLFLSSAYIEKGDLDKAVEKARRASELSPAQTTSLVHEAFAQTKAGRRGEAEAILARLLERSRERFTPPFHIALIYHGLGDADNAFEWLEKGFAARDPKMVFLKVEPKWKDLRSDPRFVSLIRRMNLD